MNISKTYRVVLRKEPEGTYTAIVPALPGCITWGETIEHAMEMAKEAIEGYIEVLSFQFPGKKRMKTAEFLNGMSFSDVSKVA